MFDMKDRKLILDGAAIVKAARAIAKVYSSQREQLHITLVSAVNHAILHKDCTVLNQVIDAFDNTVNKRNGIALWLTRLMDEKGTRVSNLIQRKDKADNVRWLAPKGQTPAANLDILLATPFYDLEIVKKKNEEPYSFLAVIERIMSGAKKRYDAGKMKPEERPVFEALDGEFTKQWKKLKVRAEEAQQLPIAA